MSVKSNTTQTEKSWLQTAIGLVAAALYILAPDTANAAASGSISDSMTTFTMNIGVLPYFLQFVFYTIGLALVAKGLFNAKKFSESPQQAQGGMLGIVGPIVIGGMLIAAPIAAEMVMNSLSTTGTANDALTHGNVASGETVGNAIDNFGKATFGGGKNGLFDLISYICYIIGIILLGSALQGAYRITVSAQGAPKISGVVWRAIGAGLLMMMPHAVQIIRASFFDSPSAIHDLELSKFDVVTGPGIDAALTSFVNDVKSPVIDITFAICFACGIIMIGQALYAMSGIGFEQQKLTPGQILTRLIMGGLLMSSMSIYHAVTVSLFGSSPLAASHVLAYTSDFASGADADRITNVVNAILAWVQLVGVIAFFRGWFTLKGSLDGTANSPKSAGLTQVIAGALLINMPTTLTWIGNSLGVQVFSS